MNKIHLSMILGLLAVPCAFAAGPDIIYVDGKPVYIGGLEEPAADAKKKSLTAQEEAARSNIPGDIYRGTVLGHPQRDSYGKEKQLYRGTILGENQKKADPKNNPSLGQQVPGDIYRGTIFGQEKKKYDGDTLGKRELAKTKFVYDTSLVRAIKSSDADRVRTLIYANVDVNERNFAGITPLTIASEKGNLRIIQLLIE